MDDQGVTHPVGIDPDQAIWRRYAVRTPPAVVLIAPGGKLLRGWPGGVDTDRLKRRVGSPGAPLNLRGPGPFRFGV